MFFLENLKPASVKKSYLDAPLRSLHIELTSKCALSCPRCTRTMNLGKFPLTELSLPLIEQRFHKDMLMGLEEILFCGAHGDPIYHSRFHEVLRHFRQSALPKISIVTNGSHRPQSWWEGVRDILRPDDCVKFSIDGLEDTNHLYRQKSRWTDVMDAVNVLSGRVHLEWKFIVFKHNQHQIEAARELARQLGFNSFEIVKSSTFDGHFIPAGESVDPLKPDPQFVALPVSNSGNPIYPACMNGRYHFISASGQYLPCCWSGNFPNDSEKLFKKYNRQRNLHYYSLEEILRSSGLKKLKESWQSPNTAPSVCRNTCNKPVNTKHNDMLFDVERHLP